MEATLTHLHGQKRRESVQFKGVVIGKDKVAESNGVEIGTIRDSTGPIGSRTRFDHGVVAGVGETVLSNYQRFQ